ncbi:S1C family serine protease [Caenimonas soli]|uniref:S1C family serine protease n=1 Tax=Caenimonas soli TaxID=2735555 RepID=UPI0015561350|nr:trypsin-like peptidase domain-containing protein [Caenimonas soli]NPC54717.1 trypsin-like serine protease [Caenimonas soli]
MRRQALYSSSRSGRPGQNPPQAATPEVTPPAPAKAATPSRFSLTSPKLLWAAILMLAALLVFSISLGLRPTPRKLTQADINAAVLKTLETQNIPSEYAKAYDKIRPSVVRVVSYVKKSRLKEESPSLPKGGAKPKPLGPANGEADKAGPDDEVEHGVGTGVVIVDKGIILTNLHVVSGADRIMVTFSDGLEAQASITGVQAENDLAVLQASKIPDDMIAATMRSTSDLGTGDKVLAVGFPFGIGPSASGGVVSGLKRAFRSPEGKQEMSNLIQFDAAANPGNSGGPLVTMDGEVVGIVTAILNPTPARTFLGIAFAVPIENAASAAGLPPF